MLWTPEILSGGFWAILRVLSRLGTPAWPAEPIPGAATRRLAAIAQQHGFWMVAGMIEAGPDGGKPYNAAAIISPSGERQ